MRSKLRWRRRSTKEIALVGKYGVGKVAVVDDEDFEWLSLYRWYGTRWGYAIAYVNDRPVPMHRLIMRTPDDMVTDHINGERLDNQKANLRNCTQAENTRNTRKHKAKSSRFKGVSWETRTETWRVQIGMNNRTSTIGRFTDEAEAAFAYNEAAALLFGEFACLNAIPSSALTPDRAKEITEQVRAWLSRSTFHTMPKRNRKRPRRKAKRTWWGRVKAWLRSIFG